MKELKNNDKGIYFCCFGIFFWSIRICYARIKKVLVQIHYLCKPLFINAALVLLPSKAVKVCFNLFKNCSSKC